MTNIFYTTDVVLNTENNIENDLMHVLHKYKMEVEIWVKVIMTLFETITGYL